MNGSRGDGEDRRDRVDREDQVGHLDQTSTRNSGVAVAAGRRARTKKRAVVVVGDRQQPAQQAHAPGSSRARSPASCVISHLDAGEDQEGAEEVDDPVEPLEQRGARQDHGRAHDQRAEDAPEEHPVLVLAGTRK